jgi:signal recognition particle subunit SRP54
MTPKERHKPDILNGSRRARIARGAGRTVQEVNRLIDQHKAMQKLMKQMKGMGMMGMMRGGMPRIGRG